MGYPENGTTFQNVPATDGRRILWIGEWPFPQFKTGIMIIHMVHNNPSLFQSFGFIAVPVFSPMKAQSFRPIALDDVVNWSMVDANDRFHAGINDSGSTAAILQVSIQALKKNHYGSSDCTRDHRRSASVGVLGQDISRDLGKELRITQ